MFPTGHISKEASSGTRPVLSSAREMRTDIFKRCLTSPHCPLSATTSGHLEKTKGSLCADSTVRWNVRGQAAVCPCFTRDVKTQAGVSNPWYMMAMMWPNTKPSIYLKREIFCV